MTLVEEIGQWLEDNGHGTQGTDIFIDGLPASGQVSVVALRDITARPPVLEHDSVVAQMTPNLQVVVRGDGPLNARTKAGSVFMALASIVNTTMADGKVVYRLNPISTPFSIGRDQQGDLMAMNFEVDHQP